MEKTTTEKRLDRFSLEMIIILAIISLHDFLISDVLSLPLALQHSSLAYLRSLDRIVSSLEYIVPVLFFAALLVLFLFRRNAWERYVAMGYLGWVTLRLLIKIVLVIIIITSRPQNGVGVLLKDTFVLWIVNFVLFGTWYWIIDAGGPRARHDGPARRYDFAFPQRMLPLQGWEKWQPAFLDYLFLGFSSNTQFGLGDTQVLSMRGKLMIMLQITLSMIVVVFMASFAITLLR